MVVVVMVKEGRERRARREVGSRAMNGRRIMVAKRRQIFYRVKEVAI